jgi:hypothetical protein
MTGKTVRQAESDFFSVRDQIAHHNSAARRLIRRLPKLVTTIEAAREREQLLRHRRLDEMARKIRRRKRGNSEAVASSVILNPGQFHAAAILRCALVMAWRIASKCFRPSGPRNI